MALNRFGDPGKYRVQSAQMLATTMHLLRGTPYIYMGEEIGMINPDYQSIDDYDDVEAKNAYQSLLDAGKSKEEAFAIVKYKARDNSRTPMHWNSERYAGFSQVKPWLMPTDQDRINVEKELAQGQIFNYYQKLIALRKNSDLIAQGHVEPLFKDDQQVLAYRRFLPGQSQSLLVFNNFSKDEASLDLDKYQGKSCQVLISNYQSDLTTLPADLKLAPYQSLAVLINE
ncbi:alpha,alpha-phosphotrehalase [Lactobacillus pasteurii DSM 23907 = CRBIP 24.76]|uniref:Alpha,alpha-phosphotrehalase n=1 Tax=Lactobacillus pasteurii DSM 23907 = CRBIP 24.76 TaxID=1423790 RepID=I7JZ79_9LACO|nr:alpha,alpha-phosphotrehalase [Lactobacillus pasteurii DSM 23907 = CRBIP 24.76]TDG78107.1 hypothetical protein C5L33_000170 [Lactobacillus pasteurii]CCI86085.1 Alpha,alpha-phosphotrehalase [Lactobacillus pasteurii DSM 23907 = CRBIP 24.76]